MTNLKLLCNFIPPLIKKITVSEKNNNKEVKLFCRIHEVLLKYMKIII